MVSPKVCFSCAVTLIFLGLMAIVPGLAYVMNGEKNQTAGIIMLTAGAVMVVFGIPVCRHSMLGMRNEKIEFMAQQSPGPVICGLLPGKPVAGNYTEQTQPLNQPDRGQTVGYFSQMGSYRPESGYRQAQTGSTGSSVRNPEATGSGSGSGSLLYQQLPGDQGYQQQQQQQQQQQRHATSQRVQPGVYGGVREQYPPSYSDVMYGPRSKSTAID